MRLISDISLKDRASERCLSEDEYKRFCEIIDAEPTAGEEWIPCSERLPDRDGYYLVSANDNKVMIGYYYVKRNRWDWWMCNVEIKLVSAWQHLPEPYKEGTR